MQVLYDLYLLGGPWLAAHLLDGHPPFLLFHYGILGWGAGREGEGAQGGREGGRKGCGGGEGILDT